MKDLEKPSILSVSTLNRAIRNILEGEFGYVWVRGEISNFKAHTSGHFYFSLKDKNAQISAVMFRGSNYRLSFRPQNGQEIIARGRVSVYESRGNYQIICDSLEQVGEGALQEAFEKLKKKLKEEGLFESSQKKRLPSWPRHVAVISSPTGAAIQDMIHVLNRRNRGLKFTLVPSLVQGRQAASDIVRAIKEALKLKDVDVLILARGGGSIEDLWCFNEEIVARAIVSCSIPVISAVGHEVDFTIADFVADHRAPTPSAAAEVVIKSFTELEEKLKNLNKNLNQALLLKIKEKKHRLEILEKGLIDPVKYLEDMALRCDDLEQRLGQLIRQTLRDKRHKTALCEQKLISPKYLLEKIKIRLLNGEKRLEGRFSEIFQNKKHALATQTSLLDSLSPLAVVSRGYSLVTNKKGQTIKTIEQVAIGEILKIKIAKGELSAQVKEIR